MQCNDHKDLRPINSGAQSGVNPADEGHVPLHRNEYVWRALTTLARHAPDAQVHLGNLVRELARDAPNLMMFLPKSRQTLEASSEISSVLLSNQSPCQSKQWHEQSTIPASSCMISSQLSKLESRVAALEATVAVQASLLQDLLASSNR